MASTKSPRRNGEMSHFNFENITKVLENPNLNENTSYTYRKTNMNLDSKTFTAGNLAIETVESQNYKRDKSIPKLVKKEVNLRTIPNITLAKSKSENHRIINVPHTTTNSYTKSKDFPMFEEYFPKLKDAPSKKGDQYIQNETRSSLANSHQNSYLLSKQEKLFKTPYVDPKKQYFSNATNFQEANKGITHTHFTFKNRPRIASDEVFTAREDGYSQIGSFFKGKRSDALRSQILSEKQEIEEMDQQARSTSPKITHHETFYPWKEKSKSRKIFDAQLINSNISPTQRGNLLRTKQEVRHRNNSISELPKEIEISTAKIIKRLEKIMVDYAYSQEAFKETALPSPEIISEDNNLIGIRAPYQIRDKNYFFALRLESYMEFINKVSFSNMLFVIPLSKSKIQQIYKYHVMKGNNHMVIKNAFKQRWWWQSTEIGENKNYDNVNFLWSPWRVNNFLKTLKKYDYGTDESTKDSSDTQVAPIIFVQSSHEDLCSKWAKSKIHEGKLINDPSMIADPKFASNINKIFSHVDLKNSNLYEEHSQSELMHHNTDKLNKCFIEQYKRHTQNSSKYKFAQSSKTLSQKMCNHLENNFLLSDKKALFINLKNYYMSQNIDPFEYIPLTFHIRKSTEDTEYKRFKEYYEQYKLDPTIKNIWILKPGENTNRGTGIIVCQSLEEIEGIISQDAVQASGKQKTFILQKYIEKPLLYQKRKFDIRCFLLISTVNGIQKGYWYQDGYIRTSSAEFSLDDVKNRLVHLTNDAVQKKGDDYGKHESGNKIAYTEFQRYLDTTMPDKRISIANNVCPQMKKLALDAILSVYGRLDPQRRENSFELFGLDFMLDETGKPWLIEINTNPCLDLSAPLLSKIIPAMIENVFRYSYYIQFQMLKYIPVIRIAIDPVFPPPVEWPTSKRGWVPENCMDNNKFELIFDERDAERFGFILKQNYEQIMEECDEDYDADIVE